MALTPDELADWSRYAATRAVGDRNRLVMRYQPVVRHHAEFLASRIPGFTADELASDGQIGLLSAIDAFDLGRGVQFTTFADRRIRGSMIDAVRKADHAPRLMRKQRRIVAQVTADCLARDGMDPSIDEVAFALGVSPETALRILRDGPPPDVASLTSVLFASPDGGKDLSVGEFLTDDGETDPTAGLNTATFFETVTRGMSRIERAVIELLYRSGVTMREAGIAIGLSEARISQINAQLLRRIKSRADVGKLSAAA